MPIKKNLYKYPAYFIIIFIITFAFIGLFLNQTNYFKIKKIFVNKKEINKNSILAKEENIYSVNIKNVINKVKSLYKVYSVEVIKKYPDTLIINIVESEIIALLYVAPKKKNKILYGLNKKGKIVKYFQTNDKYPIIKTSIWDMREDIKENKYPIGANIKNKEIIQTLFALYVSKKININFFRNIKIINLFDKKDKNFFLIKNIKTKFLFGKELKLLQLMKLMSLIKYDLRVIERFGEIDLRFNSIIAKKKKI